MEINCPNCGASLEFTDGMRGELVTCRECENVIEMPIKKVPPDLKPASKRPLIPKQVARVVFVAATGYLLLLVLRSMDGLFLGAHPQNDDPQSRGIDVEKQRERRHTDALSQVKIKNATWSTAGGGSILKASFTIENHNNFHVYDVEIEARSYGNSGTTIGKASRIVRENIPAGRSIRVSNLSFGFIDEQTATASFTPIDLQGLPLGQP